MEKKTTEKQKVSVKKQQWKPGNMLYPLPAVLVSLGREGEKPNLITVAWTGTVCTNPPMVYISVRPERYSYSILKETKTFVINLTTEKLLKATDYCGVRSGRDVDKFKETGLTAIPGPVTGLPHGGRKSRKPGVQSKRSESPWLPRYVPGRGSGRPCLRGLYGRKRPLLSESDRPGGLFPRRIFQPGKKTWHLWLFRPETGEEKRKTSQINTKNAGRCQKPFLRFFNSTLEPASCVNGPVIFTVLGSRVIWLHSFLAVTSLPLRIACSPYFFRILSRAASSFCCFSFFSQSISKMES